MDDYAGCEVQKEFSQKGYALWLKAMGVFQPALYSIATNAYDIQAVALEPTSPLDVKESFFGIKPVAKYGHTVDVLPEDIGQLSVSNASMLFFRNATLCESVVRTISILDVERIAASRSDLSQYDSIADFGEKMYILNRRDSYHSSMSEDRYFAHCLSGLKSGGNRFSLNCWSPSLEWKNSDGSHRFATAHYMAKHRTVNHVFDATIQINRLNRDWLSVLLQTYNMYFFKTSQDVDLFKLFDMRNSKHTFVVEPVPFGILGSYDETSRFRTILLLLHKAERVGFLAKHWIRQNLEGMEFENHYARLVAIEDATLMRPYLQMQCGIKPSQSFRPNSDSAASFVNV